MIAYWDIIQGTESWHKIRYRKIGGSSAKGIFVESDTLLIDILAQNLEPFKFNPEPYLSADMQRGHDLENEARMFINKYKGIDEFLECGWIQGKNNLLGISPDGVSKNLEYACEIKCLGAKAHTQCLLEDEIPREYIFQCLHYFTVIESLCKLYFISYRPESEKSVFIKILTPTSLVNIGTNAKKNYKKISELVNESHNKIKDFEKKLEIVYNKIIGI